MNGVSTGLKLIAKRRSEIRVSSFTSLALASSSFYESEHKPVLSEDSIALDDPSLWPDPENISAESRESSELSFENDDGSRKLVDKPSSIRNYQNTENYGLRQIKSLLSKHIGKGNSVNCYEIDLDQSKFMQILHDLFLECSDASLSLYFYRWSEHCVGSKHSLPSICILIQILIARNMNCRAIDLIKCIVRSNKGQEDWWFGLVMKVFDETHFKKQVLMTASSMLVDCYVNEGMLDAVPKLTTEMKKLGIFPSIGVCNKLLKVLLKSGKLELAWDFFEEMKSLGMTCNASIISLFIHKFCIDGELRMGLKLLMEMKLQFGAEPDVVAFTIVIDSLCKRGLLKEATSVLFKMILSGIPVDSVVVSSLIEGYSRTVKLEKLNNILKFFRVPPNIYLYNSLITRSCTCGNMITAVNLFEEVLKMGLRPDCFIYTTLIGGFCRIGKIYNALSFLGQMLRRGIRRSVVTYTALINGYAKFGDMDGAKDLFDKMLAEGLSPDVVLYNVLMHGYGKEGHVSKAYHLLHMMMTVGMKPDIVTYNALIHGLVNRGFIIEAKDVVEELIRRGLSPDIVTFTSIISGLSNKGNFEEAFLLWSYMDKINLKPNVVTCSALLNGYCKVGCMDKVKKLFGKMLNIGLVPDLVLYNTLIHGFCRVGNIDDALNLVNMMVERGGIIPNEVTHRALIIGYEKKGFKDPSKAATFKLEEIMPKQV